MQIDLEGKVALVTGGGRGIGRVIATQLAQNGTSVLIATRPQASGQAVVDEIGAMGGKAALVALDLSTREACDAAVQGAITAFGGLDIVVHNSAIFPFTPLEALADDEFDQVLRTNLYSFMWLARIFVNHRDPGKIAPSIASLFVALRRLFSDTAVDPAMVGAEQLAAWSWAMNRYADWRSGEGRDADIFDVRFRDLTARPMDLVAELYDHFSMVLSATAREHMLRHLDHDHHAKAPQRAYTLAEFGMSEAMIEQQFARYIAHFGIQREQRR